MEIKEINNKETWEQFVVLNNPWAFFQSWNWGEVEKKLGKKVYRLGFFQKDELLGVGQIVKMTAKRGVFFHLRHGPVFKTWKGTYLDRFLEEVKKLAKKEKAYFIRFSPMVPSDHFLTIWYKKHKLKKFPIPDLDAQRCWVLPLLKRSREELLMGMRKTTRYLIHKAEKMGAEIIKGGEKDIDGFLGLYYQTAHRHHFVPHQGIREEMKVFTKDNQAELFLGKYQGKILLGVLIVFWGKQAIYHHGASLFSEVPVSHLAQWKAIEEAQRRGMEFYNFWGVAPEGKPNHPWRGLTLFKKGFGGGEKVFLEAYDLPLSPLYYVSRFIDRARKIYRRV